VCCKCGGEIPPGWRSQVLALAPGRYVCAACEEERELRRKYGVADRELIERIKMYSMDYEGEHT
jgi:RNA polymerase-binding transcription factor DksA